MKRTKSIRHGLECANENDQVYSPRTRLIQRARNRARVASNARNAYSEGLFTHACLIDCHPNLDKCLGWLRAYKRGQSGLKPLSWQEWEGKQGKGAGEEERKRKKRRRRRCRMAMGLLAREWLLSLSPFHFLSLDLGSILHIDSLPCKRWQLESMGSKSSHSGSFGITLCWRFLSL